MSGSYIDAAGPTIAADAAAAAAEIAPALAVNAKRQAESRAFITEHGAAVLNGHTEVDTTPPSLLGTM